MPFLIGLLARPVPSSCRLWADRAGRPRAMLARIQAAAATPLMSAHLSNTTRPCGAVLAGGDVVAAEMEEVADLVLGGKETLRLAGRLEALHLPFSSARRLVRVFDPVVEALVPAVLDPGH